MYLYLSMRILSRKEPALFIVYKSIEKGPIKRWFFGDRNVILDGQSKEEEEKTIKIKADIYYEKCFLPKWILFYVMRCASSLCEMF